MTPLFPAQRAAEEFDQVVSGTAPPGADDRFADLLETVTALRAQPEVLPRAEFVGDLRSRLMTAAETELVASPSVVRPFRTTRPPRTGRRFGTVAASLVIVGGTAGMAAAANGALPGDGLYPIKRGVEHAETIARLSDASKGRALLGQADTRLGEVRSLQGEGSPDSALVASTLDSFTRSADSGAAKLFDSYRKTGDAADITAVRTFTKKQMDEIGAISGTSATTDAALVDAADTLADIDQQARGLCASCGPAEPVAPPASLAAGAAAVSADTLLARPVAQAGADIAKVEAQTAAALAALANAAEKQAGTVPLIDPDDLVKRTSSTTGGPSVTSTIAPDGTLQPSFSTGVAVKDLVSGVTQSLEDLTKKVTGGQTPVDRAVEDLTKTVDGVTGGVTDGLTEGLENGLTKGLSPSAAPTN